MLPVLKPFVDFPVEGSIVGRLLAGYAILEVDLMNCVSVARNDLDATLKVMFRARGETQRIDVADALGRQHYAAHRLDTEFSMAIADMRHCLKVRNQYAHCVWHNDLSGRLSFLDLEEIATSHALIIDLSGLTHHYLDATTLQQQEVFAGYVDDLLAWVNYEGRVRAGTLASHNLSKPPQIPRPPLHIP